MFSGPILLPVGLGDCMKQNITIDHIGIAANNLDEGSRFWRLIGLVAQGEDELVEEQGVVTRSFLLILQKTIQPILKF